MQVDEEKFPALPGAPTPAPPPPSPPPAASQPPKRGHDYGLWGPLPPQDPNPSTAHLGTLKQQQSSWDNPDPVEAGWGQGHPQETGWDPNPTPYQDAPNPDQNGWGQGHPQQDDLEPKPAASQETKPARQWQQHWDQTDQQQSSWDQSNVPAQGIWEQPQGSRQQEPWQNPQQSTWDPHQQGTWGQPPKQARVNQAQAGIHALPAVDSSLTSNHEGWYDEQRLGWESGPVPTPQDPNVPWGDAYPGLVPSATAPHSRKYPPHQDSWGQDPVANANQDGWGYSPKLGRGEGSAPGPHDHPPNSRSYPPRGFGQGPSSTGLGSKQTEWDPRHAYQADSHRYINLHESVYI